MTALMSAIAHSENRATEQVFALPKDDDSKTGDRLS